MIQWSDPYTGQTYDIPQFEETVSYTPEQQALYDKGNQVKTGLADLAIGQTNKLRGFLDTPFSTKGAPAAGDASRLALPSYANYSGAPKLQTSFGDAGSINGDFLTSIEDPGDVTRSYGANDFSADRDKVQAALMDRMQPQIDKDRRALETKLTNQGIRVGSTAYGASEDTLNRGVNDARLSTIINAGQEQSRLVAMDRDRASFQNAAQAQEYGQNANDAQFANSGKQLSNAAQQQIFDQLMARAGFGNSANQQNFANDFQVTGANNDIKSKAYQAALTKIQQQNAGRSQYLQELYAERNQPINEITGLMSGAQVVAPQFGGIQMPNIPTTDVAGLINTNYDQRVNKAMTEYQASQGMLGGLFSLGSAGIMASDERVKEDIERVGKTDDGQPIYFYRYKDDPEKKPQLGLMAQDVEKRDPKAVVEIDGIKHVNYPRALSGLFDLEEAA